MVLICISLIMSDVEHFFHVFVSHGYVFFGKCLFSSLAHFLIGSFFCGIELQELLVYFEINSLSVASFANIFSHSEDSLFTLLIVSFIVQKLLNLIRFYLFIFAFISITGEVGQRESYCDLCQRVFCLCSPLRVS